MQFDQAIHKFRQSLSEQRERPCTPVTIAGYMRNISRLRREIGELVGPGVDKRLATWRLEQQRRVERKEVGASKVRCDVAVLRTFFDAIGQKGVPNPARAIRSMPKEKRLPRPMPLHQIQALVATIDLSTDDGLRDRTMIELYYHGLRNHEVSLITTHNVTFDPTEDTFTIRIFGKGRKEALTMVSPAAAPLLASFLIRRFAPGDELRSWESEFATLEPERRMCLMAERVLGRLVMEEPQTLFQVHGHPFTVRDSNRMFALRRDAAGISKEFGPHSLRHAFGTQLLEASVDLRVVQELMRHEDIRTTTLYTKVSKGLKLTAVSRLPALAGGG